MPLYSTTTMNIALNTNTIGYYDSDITTVLPPQRKNINENEVFKQILEKISSEEFYKKLEQSVLEKITNDYVKDLEEKITFKIKKDLEELFIEKLGDIVDITNNILEKKKESKNKLNDIKFVGVDESSDINYDTIDYLNTIVTNPYVYTHTEPATNRTEPIRTFTVDNITGIVAQQYNQTIQTNLFEPVYTSPTPINYNTNIIGNYTDNTTTSLPSANNVLGSLPTNSITAITGMSTISYGYMNYLFDQIQESISDVRPLTQTTYNNTVSQNYPLFKKNWLTKSFSKITSGMYSLLDRIMSFL